MKCTIWIWKHEVYKMCSRRISKSLGWPFNLDKCYVEGNNLYNKEIFYCDILWVSKLYIVIYEICFKPAFSIPQSTCAVHNLCGEVETENMMYQHQAHTHFPASGSSFAVQTQPIIWDPAITTYPNVTTVCLIMCTSIIQYSLICWHRPHCFIFHCSFPVHHIYFTASSSQLSCLLFTSMFLPGSETKLVIFLHDVGLNFRIWFLCALKCFTCP